MCIVISHYDARPLEPLICLLRQLRVVPAGADSSVVVVVNSVTGRAPAFPEDLAGTDVLVRANAGFNIGAWQAGWQARPGHDVYVFLQDECVIRRAGWLEAFRQAAARPDVGLVGEAEFAYFGWTSVDAMWPDIHRRYDALRAGTDVPAGYAPTHIQMTAVAARREVLEHSGGFLTGDDKATACGGEILSSVRMRHLGYRNRQVSFRPYTYVAHPQWEAYTASARSLRWAVSRRIRHALALLDEPARLLRRRRARAAQRTAQS